MVAGGWLCEDGSATCYSHALALFPEDVMAWVESTQPKAWESIKANHGARASKVLTERLRKALDAQGLLEVLRQGFDLLGLRKPISICQFRQALAMNPDLQAKYAANRLRVLRQIRYSEHNENNIGLVFFR